MNTIQIFFAFLVISLCAITPLVADVTFDCDSATITISDKGHWLGIIDKSTGRDLCNENSARIAVIYDENGKYRPVSSFKRSGKNYILKFAPTDTVLTYSIEPFAEWFHFRLIAIQGTRPQNITFCQVPVNITENLGRLLNIAWDDKTSICLLAASLQPDCKIEVRNKVSMLTASAQDTPGPNLEGTSVALIVSPTPDIRNRLRRASHAFGMLINEDHQGVPSKETLGKKSYWFLFQLTENDADRVIEYCKLANIDQVLIGFHNWAKSSGHVEYNTKYFPDGLDSIKRLVKKLNDAGIGLGAHTFVSKIQKNDAYVTPIPDKRFWNDLPFVTLREDIDEKATTIKAANPIDQWPGSLVCKKKNWEADVKKHQEFTLNNEIIRYKSIDPNTNTFLGCSRASYGTILTAHKAGDQIHHYAWESSGMYIIDPETNLIDETARRMAQAFNECGFNMIYFDGGEDVPKNRFAYYASLVQQKTLQLITKKPFIHMGTAKTHRLWHSFTIGSTVDVYLNTYHKYVGAGKPIPKTCKQHIDNSVKRVIAAQKSLIPGEFGWFGIWPETQRKGRIYQGLQLDQIEYVMTKCLAYDAPISLETSFEQMDKHPLTTSIVKIVGMYEKMRHDKSIDHKTIDMLKQTGKDYAYIRTADKNEFVQLEELDQVAGTHDIRSFIGKFDNGDAVATIWHYKGTPTPILLPENSNVKLVCFQAKELPMETVGSDVKIPVDHRRLTLIFPNTSIEQAKQFLSNAKLSDTPAKIQACPVKKATDKSLLAHWSFDTDTKNLGSAGAIADGILLADAVITDDPERGMVLTLDGYEDAMEHKMSLPKQKGTIAHWIRPLLSTKMPIVFETNGGNENIRTMLYRYKAVFVYQDGASDINKSGSTYLFNAGQTPRKKWSHIAVTYDLAGDIIIYVNGKEARRAPLVTEKTKFESLKPTAHYIGRELHPESHRYFKGSIDEVRIYDRVLSSEEIVQLMKP